MTAGVDIAASYSAFLEPISESRERLPFPEVLPSFLDTEQY